MHDGRCSSSGFYLVVFMQEKEIRSQEVLTMKAVEIYHNLKEWNFDVFSVYKLTKDEARAVMGAIRFKANFDELYRRFKAGDKDIFRGIDDDVVQMAKIDMRMEKKYESNSEVSRK